MRLTRIAEVGRATGILLLCFSWLFIHTAQAADDSLRAGDVLYIALPGEAGFNEEFQVDRQGRVTLPEVGVVRVAGLSLKAAREKLRKKLAVYYRDMTGFSLFLRERKLLITVSGSVINPGEVELTDNGTVEMAIKAAGGLEAGAQLDAMQVKRGKDVIKFNYKRFLDTGDASILPALRPLDVVFVPVSPLTGNVKVEFDAELLGRRGDSAEDEKAVKIFGEVHHPGSFSYRPDANLIDYLMLAGGVTMHAGVDQIRVISSGVPLPVNLTRFLDTGNQENLPKLVEDSIIFVPRKETSVAATAKTVYVMGEVGRPGAYEAGKNARFLDILANAGGPTRFAETRNIRILKQDGSIQTFDMDAYIEGRPGVELPSVVPGDAIFIPEKSVQGGEKSWLDTLPENAIYLIGAINKPGRFEWNDDMSLLDLLAHGGGPNSTSDVAKITIVPGGKDEGGPPVYFNLDTYLNQGSDKSTLPRLGAGYTVMIPELPQDPSSNKAQWVRQPSESSIYVLGEVGAPGRYRFDPAFHLLDILGAAEGPSHTADLREIRIIHRNGTQTSVTNTNLARYIETGDESLLPSVMPQDVIFVPPKSSEWGSRAVFVLGEVGKPGAYELRTGADFMRIITDADGPTRFADTRNIRIIQRNAQSRPFDMEAFLNGRVGAVLPDIQAGDTIFVPEKTDILEKSWLKLAPERAIRIVGSVHNPGRYEWSDEMSILDLLAHAGGPTAKADVANITVVPGGIDKGQSPIKFDLDSYQTLGTEAAIPKLRAGYSVIVPELPDDPHDNKARWVRQSSDKSIYVMGEVHAPGRYMFNNAMNFLDILAAADGPTAVADIRNIRITHRHGGDISLRDFDLADYFDRGDEASLPEVRTEDVIFIPSTKGPVRGLSVIGAVNNPGRYEWAPDLTLVDLVADAGGPHQQADIAHIVIMPGGKDVGQPAIEFDLQSYYAQKNTMPLPKLGAGYSVMVPELPIDPTDDKTQWTRLAAENSIYIIGRVVSPGRYAFNDSLGFLDILAAAEGPADDADLHNIQIAHRDGEKTRINEFSLAQYFRTGDETLIPQVSTGDLIFIPSKSAPFRSISIIGGVHNPGRYEWDRSMTLSDLIAQAGGPNDQADITNITVTPAEPGAGKKAAEFNYQDWLRHGGKQPDIGPGYTVMVPERPDEDDEDQNMSWLRLAQEDAIYIVGRVNEPGRYAFDESVGFLDILSAADGPASDADLANIQIAKRGETGTQIIEFSFSEYMRTGNEYLIPHVKNGDVIFVPSKDAPFRGINMVGAVHKPGRIEWSSDLTLVDLISQAGGPSENADLANVLIKPAPGAVNQEPAHFDFDRYMRHGQTGHLPDIQPGYTVFIPELPDDDEDGDNKQKWLKLAQEDSIYVLGAVHNPGRYAFNSEMHFLDILAAAEGPKDNADLHNVRISHRNGPHAQVSGINLALYFETSDENILPQVLPGDVIYVPQRDRQWLDESKETTVRILGSVKNPGRYRFNNTMTILDLLAEAGGPNDAADVHHIQIVNLSCCRDEARNFDLREFASTGNFGDLPVVRPGDTIYVPVRIDTARRDFFDVIRDMLSVLSLVVIAREL